MESSAKHASSKLKAYHESIQDTLDIDDFNIFDKISKASAISASWITVLYNEKDCLKFLQRERDLVKDTYINSLDENCKAYLKDKMAEENCPRLKDLDKAIKIQEDIVLFLKESNEVIKQFSWTIKNVIELKKLER